MEGPSKPQMKQRFFNVFLKPSKEWNFRCSFAKSCSANSSLPEGHVCSCINGYTGRNCSECAEGFEAASNGTCRAIPCHLPGTASYNATVNSCACKSNYNGKLCDRCASGFVGFKVGCRPCYCSSRGVTNCSDASGDYNMQQVRDFAFPHNIPQFSMYYSFGNYMKSSYLKSAKIC